MADNKLNTLSGFSEELVRLSACASERAPRRGASGNKAIAYGSGITTHTVKFHVACGSV